ncbi:MAG: putative toxin-antitoxin system toxin component, PIN family [Magnetospirillum sp.]|nr:putative toxin-antitoxin system toxin component, PIN family [Magnetospirillum sp.]
MVLDTDVVVSGLRSNRGASRILLIAVSENVIVPLATVAMILEYEAVLKRQDNLNAIGLTAGEVDEFLDDMMNYVEFVIGHFTWRPSIKDANDKMFVDAAFNGCADVMVSFNQKDYLPADGGDGYLGIEVCRPGDVLRRLEWRPSATLLSAFRPR